MIAHIMACERAVPGCIYYFLLVEWCELRSAPGYLKMKMGTNVRWYYSREMAECLSKDIQARIVDRQKFER